MLILISGILFQSSYAAEPYADDKEIIKKAEELFDDITITTV